MLTGWDGKRESDLCFLKRFDWFSWEFEFLLLNSCPTVIFDWNMKMFLKEWVLWICLSPKLPYPLSNDKSWTSIVLWWLPGCELLVPGSATLPFLEHLLKICILPGIALWSMESRFFQTPLLNCHHINWVSKGAISRETHDFLPAICCRLADGWTTWTSTILYILHARDLYLQSSWETWELFKPTSEKVGMVWGG